MSSKLWVSTLIYLHNHGTEIQIRCGETMMLRNPHRIKLIKQPLTWTNWTMISRRKQSSRTTKMHWTVVISRGRTRMRWWPSWNSMPGITTLTLLRVSWWPQNKLPRREIDPGTLLLPRLPVRTYWTKSERFLLETNQSNYPRRNLTGWQNKVSKRDRMLKHSIWLTKI